MSIMSDDTKIKRLKRKYGLQGYGLYVLILEYISKQLDKHSPLPDLQEKAEDIADEWGCDIREVNEMMLMMVNEGLFEIHYITGSLVCTKIEKYLDEYIRKIPEIGDAINDFKNAQYEQTYITQEDSKDVQENPTKSDKLPLEQNRREENRREESNREADKDSPLPTSLDTKKDCDRWKRHVNKPGAGDLPPGFPEIWQEYPRKTDKKKAALAYLETRKVAGFEELLHAVKVYAAEQKDNDAKYIKHAKTFFGPSEPWRDYAEKDLTEPKDHVNVISKTIFDEEL